MAGTQQISRDYKGDIMGESREEYTLSQSDNLGIPVNCGVINKPAI